MPMPVAHAAVGLAVYESLRYLSIVPPAVTDSGGAVLLIALAANAPDIDIIPWLRECIRTRSFDPLGFKPHHREWTHSLLCGVGFALIMGFFAARHWSGSFAQWGFLLFVLYCSHILSDVLVTSRAEHGVQVFWPFTKTRYSVIRAFPALFPKKPTSIAQCLKCEVGIVLTMLTLTWFLT